MAALLGLDSLALGGLEVTLFGVDCAAVAADWEGGGQAGVAEARQCSGGGRGGAGHSSAARRLPTYFCGGSFSITKSVSGLKRDLFFHSNVTLLPLKTAFVNPAISPRSA